ncbi:MAG: chromosome segregation protein SMC [Dissulfurispiraceae bacterium]
MKIRQIELIGFKSFADRIPLALHNGITCIVGPNGCGKSNIVDAFRWVLGEQSAKSLRGEKMEEVIFLGSTTKKQKGMAEVTLVLSQSTHSVKEESPRNGDEGSSEEDSSDKITVSRRLYRSGESEYILNKRQCRLRDIRDIFLDTGLDVKSYSILDQGRITDILNTKPHERRFLIEEVAGVMKYKVRRAEALSKLDSSKQNLQRINDIVYEVRRQLNSLDRQAKKAGRYKRLMAELTEIEQRIAKREYCRLGEKLHILLSSVVTLKEKDSVLRGELSTIENAMETKRLELVDEEKVLAALENSFHEKDKAIADSERQMAIIKINSENKESEISRLTDQQKDMTSKQEGLSKKIAELDSTGKNYLSNLEGISDELREKRERLSDMEGSLVDGESEIEKKRKELFSISENLSNKKNELYKLQSSSDALQNQESISINDMATITGKFDELTQAVQEAEVQIARERDEHLTLQSEKEGLRSEIMSLKETLEYKKELLSKERELLVSNSSRLTSLKELIIDRSLVEFLSEYGEISHISEKVLSDIVNTESNLERAIEAALSDKINALIIEDREDLLSLVRIVQERNLGRTSMLYTVFDQEYINGPENLQHMLSDKIIGRASDLLKFEDNGSLGKKLTSVQDRLRSMLQNTYIVKDIETGLEIKSSIALKGVTVVTLAGEVITDDGFVFAGQGKEILKRKREIKELQKMISGQQGIISDMENAVTALSSSLTVKRESLQGTENSIIDIEKKLSIAAHSLKNQIEELERMSRKRSLLESEISTYADEKESFRTLIKSKTQEINFLDGERARTADEIAAIQNSLSARKKEYEEERIHLTDMRTAVAAYREKIDAIKKEKNGITETMAELEREKELILREILEAKDKIMGSLAELQTLKENIKVLLTEAEKLKKEREVKKEAIATENQMLLSREQTLKRIRAEIDAVSQELSEANSKAVEDRIRLEHIENTILQKYGVAIGKEAIEINGYDPVVDADSINQLNEKIRELGPVNLGTLEEYEELKNRYDFLSQQQKDLTLSIAELEEAISRINATTRRKLREAYDALRTKFSEVFTILFGGGRADIILTEEENILESGLDIISQPPGKKLQNLNLLSGGEKALTSLALLFAGFLLKPSPLCILDEVDAALDESNTVRFAEMIKKLSLDTQFIVISHNRTTMEVANYLYGITMEEAGVSKVISLEFSDVENITYA